MYQPAPLSSRLALVESASSVTWARRHTVDVLTNWRVPDDVVETVRLVVSELATNAVQHPGRGDTPPMRPQDGSVQVFELTLEIVGPVVRVSIWDRNPKPPVLRELGPEATGGRGIFMVATMSDRWGHFVQGERLGKVVWAEVLLPASYGSRGAAVRALRAADTGTRGRGAE